MMIHNSTSRSKRYYDRKNKKIPHIALSAYDLFFHAFFALGSDKNNLSLAEDFADKLNAERAKS